MDREHYSTFLRRNVDSDDHNTHGGHDYFDQTPTHISEISSRSSMVKGGNVNGRKECGNNMRSLRYNDLDQLEYQKSLPKSLYHGKNNIFDTKKGLNDSKNQIERGHFVPPNAASSHQVKPISKRTLQSTARPNVQIKAVSPDSQAVVKSASLSISGESKLQPSVRSASSKTSTNKKRSK